MRLEIAGRLCFLVTNLVILAAVIAVTFVLSFGIFMIADYLKARYGGKHHFHP